MKLKIKWEVADGYCGKSRPQTLIIETNDYLEDDQPYEEMSDDEKQEFIDERVCDDFKQKVSYAITSTEEV